MSQAHEDTVEVMQRLSEGEKIVYHQVDSNAFIGYFTRMAQKRFDAAQRLRKIVKHNGTMGVV